MVKYNAILFFLFVMHTAKAQTSCFARVSVDRDVVFEQQPFKVTYTVYTATWFTQPLEFDDLRIPGAFIVPFTDARPGRFPANGKDYPGIQFYYLVFPYKSGRFAIPALHIVATTPPEGSSESRRITIEAPSSEYVVRPVPREFPKDQPWMVATDVQLNEHWNKPLNVLKVGDVLEQTITIDARGTLPQFIPALALPVVHGASVYAGASSLKDTRDETNANGQRQQKNTFLFTKSGKCIIPETNISWWNPYAEKRFSRKLPARVLDIEENPNLGMLTTLQDSLRAVQPAQQVQEKQVKEIFGLPWYQFLLYAIVALVFLWWAVHYLLRLKERVRTSWRKYIKSEAYWFYKFLFAPAAKPLFARRLYQWWDHRSQVFKYTAVKQTLAAQQEEAVLDAFENYEEKIFNKKSTDKQGAKKLRKLLKSYRRRAVPFPKESVLSPDQQPWK